jgi:hypothetical protein
MYALRPPRPRLGSLSHVAWCPRRRSRTIGKSTQLIGEITGIAEITEITDITGIASNSSQIRRRRDSPIAMLM